MSAICLDIKVVPNSAKDLIVGILGDRLQIKVRAVAEQNKANKAVIKLLSCKLDIAPSNIQIIAGLSNLNKRCLIEGISHQQIEALLKSTT